MNLQKIQRQSSTTQYDTAVMFGSTRIQKLTNNVELVFAQHHSSAGHMPGCADGRVYAVCWHTCHHHQQQSFSGGGTLQCNCHMQRLTRTDCMTGCTPMTRHTRLYPRTAALTLYQ